MYLDHKIVRADLHSGPVVRPPADSGMHAQGRYSTTSPFCGGALHIALNCAQQVLPKVANLNRLALFGEEEREPAR